MGEWVRKTPGLRDVLGAAAAAQVRTRDVPRSTLDGLGPGHQGVAARIVPPRELSERDLAELEFGSDDVRAIIEEWAPVLAWIELASATTDE